MRIRILALGLVGAACLYGQARRFRWQDLCFKDPAAPVCQGNDYAIKKQPAQAKSTSTTNVVTSPSVVTSPHPSASRIVTPAVIVVGGIDWRFADPFADALVGLNVSRISASPTAHDVIALLATKQGVSEVDRQKMFDGLSGVDQVALSVRNNQVVAMIIGSVADSKLPSSEPGRKAVPISAGAMLVGHSEAVDQAMQRIAMKIAPNEMMRLAEERQASSEFWAIESASALGPQAPSMGVKRFLLTVWIRDRVTSDVTLELNGVPTATATRRWEAQFGSAATVEGNTIHTRAQMEAVEVQQKIGQIADGPLGPSLAALVEAARHLPVRDNTVPKQTKPIIYGLDGGPREVNQ